MYENSSRSFWRQLNPTNCRIQFRC